MMYWSFHYHVHCPVPVGCGYEGEIWQEIATLVHVDAYSTHLTVNFLWLRAAEPEVVLSSSSSNSVHLIDVIYIVHMIGLDVYMKDNSTCTYRV